VRAGVKQRSPIVFRFQTFDLLAQTGQTFIDHGVRANWLDIANQAIELILDGAQARFQVGIATLGGRGALFGLPDLLGNPAFRLALTLHQKRNRFNQQILFLLNISAGEVSGHRAAL
jgi:hypothetical protein